MRRSLVVGNWKMNGSRATIEVLLNGMDSALDGISTEVAVCPPSPYIPLVKEALQATPITVGAQSCSEHSHGAHTGEVSCEMLTDFGCRWVLVGHSERRALYGESDADIAAKYISAKQAGLTPVLCVGESLEEREQNRAFDVVAAQLQLLLDAGEFDADTVIAYEPVWAIGTGKTASPEQAQEMHAFIRSCLGVNLADSVRLLYGGSVKADNAADLFKQTDIDGGLIGGASLIQEDFVAIAKAAS